MEKKAVVTGGAGFIGSHIVDVLLERGDEVHVIDNYEGGKHEERINPRASYHEVDLRMTDKIQPIMMGADVVFHTAATPRVPYSIEHPVETTDNNITGTVSVLTAAARAKVRRVVYSSSGSASGEQTVLPLSEDLPVNPVNPSGPYALAVGAFLLARKENRPLTIFGDGTITRDYTHVSDIVHGNMLAAESPTVGKGEVINLGAGRNVTIQHLAELIGGEITYGPPRIEAHDSQADNRKAKELLGWEPTIKLEDGIAALKKEYGLA